MVTRIPDVTVAIDFTAAVPHMSSLPADMFDINESQALATAAALFCAPDLKLNDQPLTTDGVLAVRILALFASDAWVRFSRPDFQELYARATQYKQECEDAETAEIVGWVLRRAHARACWIGLAHHHTEPLPEAQNPLAMLDPHAGRGYSVIDRGLASEFHGEVPSRRATLVPGAPKSDEQVEWERKRLLTYAALFAGCERHCCNQAAEAVVLLALYGAGVRVELTKQQFRKLERRVRDYIGTMTGHERGIQRNADMASFVVHAAQERARATGVIGGANDTEVPTGIIERMSPDGRRLLVVPDMHIVGGGRIASQFAQFAARVREQQG